MTLQARKRIMRRRYATITRFTKRLIIRLVILAMIFKAITLMASVTLAQEQKPTATPTLDKYLFIDILNITPSPALSPVPEEGKPCTVETPTPTEQPIIEQVAAAEATPELTPAPVLSNDDMIINQFGYPDAHIALRVSHAECPKHWWNYPYCVNNTPGVEYSVGLFQINMDAHAWRIPGNTWEEKSNWALQPYNNIWLAHQLYLESGWTIWGAYTNGSYLNY